MPQSTLQLVDIDDPQGEPLLKTAQSRVEFPLSEEDILFIDQLKEKVLELGAAGLAAPQVGVSRQIIAYNVTKAALEWRHDIRELVPLSVLVNPSYTPIESEGKSPDWEGCFSGKKHYGKVWRYNVIRYEGQDLQGNTIEGLARGFLARLLQHEIDHCHGKLCVDEYDHTLPHGDPSTLLSLRKAELEKVKKELGVKENHFPFQTTDLLADPKFKAFIDDFANAQNESKALSLAENRMQSTELFLASEPAREPVKRAIDIEISGKDNNQVPLRIFIPNDTADTTTSLPVMLYFHGGGWVFGNVEQSDPFCRKLCNQLHCIVVAVEYRLAPEHPFPKPLEDCYAATQWTAQNIASYGGDSSDICVCGESAGGNLAAAVALMANERHEFSIASQVLLNPAITSLIQDDPYDTCPDQYFITKDSVKWFWKCYVPNPEDIKNPYASPNYAASFSQLPPALIITAEYDPLRKEAEEYAVLLRQAGVKVMTRCFPSVVHGFLDIPPYDEEQKTLWVKEIGALYQKLRGR